MNSKIFYVVDFNEIFNNKAIEKLFKIFLKTEFNEDPILFLSAVKNFNQEKNKKVSENNESRN